MLRREEIERRITIDTDSNLNSTNDIETRSMSFIIFFVLKTLLKTLLRHFSDFLGLDGKTKL